MPPPPRTSRGAGASELLRAAAEEKLRSSSKVSSDLMGGTPDAIIHELLVHQIELEIQNEELKRAHIALEQSRDQFIDLYDFAPVGYITLTREALIVEVNLTGATMLGVVRQQLFKKRFRHFVSVPDLDLWGQFFMGVLHNDEQQTCELELSREDNTSFFARIEGIRVEKNDGAVLVRIVISDISRQRVADEINQYQRSLIEASIDPFIIISQDGKISDVNTATSEITGQSREDLIGTDFSDYCTEPEVCRRGLLSAIEKGQVRDLPLEIYHQDGVITPVLYNASVYLNERGGIMGVFAAVRDISEQKKVDCELFHLLREKEILLTEIHHRVRNTLQLLTSIMKKTRRRQSEPVKAALLMVENRLAAVSVIFDRVYQSDDLTRVNFKEAIDSIVVRLRDECSKDPRQIQVNVHAEDLDLGIDCAVPIALLTNELIANAARHAFPDGRVGTITVLLKEDDNQMVLSVRDDGIGLPDGFDPLQSDSVGCTIIRITAAQVRGVIRVESSSSGTNFIMTIPRDTDRNTAGTCIRTDI